MKITLFWLRYSFVKLLEVVFILFSFFSGAVIIAHFLKHVCKVNVIPFKWMMNDTRDGDYGAEWWREEKGFLYKDNTPKFFKWWIDHCAAFCWFIRNPCWTFKYLIVPKQGKVEIVKIIKADVPPALSWVIKNERGTNHVYFLQGGQFNGRFSHTNNLFNIMAGSEQRYIFKFRLI